MNLTINDGMQHKSDLLHSWWRAWRIDYLVWSPGNFLILINTDVTAINNNDVVLMLRWSNRSSQSHSGYITLIVKYREWLNFSETSAWPMTYPLSVLSDPLTASWVYVGWSLWAKYSLEGSELARRILGGKCQMKEELIRRLEVC